MIGTTPPFDDTCRVESCGQPTSAYPGGMRFPVCPHHWFLVPFTYRMTVADALRRGDTQDFNRAVDSLARAARDMEAPCRE